MQAPTVKCRDSEIPPTGELNDPTETRYQTKRITNIFYRETLCIPLCCKVYQPITSKCQPISRRTDILCQYAPKATGISIRWLVSYNRDGADETVNCKICSCLSRN